MAVRSAILALAILLTATITTAQRAASTSRSSSASEIRLAVDALQAAAKAANRADAPDSLSSSADWLYGSVFRPPDFKGPSTNAADVTLDYTQSLQVATELIRSNPSKQVLADIAADLETKVEHCRRLGIGMGGIIQVRVNTRRGSETVKNLQVRYLLKFYEYVKGAQPGTFARFSSPTEAPLAPGRYWIWAFDPATRRETPRTLVKVADKRELVVDVPVS
jgi:hypothetical protein